MAAGLSTHTLFTLEFYWFWKKYVVFQRPFYQYTGFQAQENKAGAGSYETLNGFDVDEDNNRYMICRSKNVD